MAASDSSKDYVHLLLARFNTGGRQVQIYRDNIAGFETGYQSYNMGTLRPYIDFCPDLVILRIGENVGSFDTVIFKLKVNELLDSITSKGLKPLIVVGPFWDMPNINQALADVAAERGQPFLDIRNLSSDLSNSAYGLFADPGVASHPSDKGMAAIADVIWASIVNNTTSTHRASRISYSLKIMSGANLSVYDLSGKLIRRLSTGTMNLNPAGGDFCGVVAGKEIIKHKMVVLR
jgi:hypothetical protein